MNFGFFFHWSTMRFFFAIVGESIEKVDCVFYFGSYITRHEMMVESSEFRNLDRPSTYMLIDMECNKFILKPKAQDFQEYWFVGFAMCMQTWKVRNQIEFKAQVFANKCLKRILFLVWPTITGAQWNYMDFERFRKEETDD